MDEVGECSHANTADDIWAKLVPSDSKYSDIEIRSNEVVVSSQITNSSLDKHEWCKITRNSDLRSAKMQNKSSNALLVDEAIVQNDDVIDIQCGSEIILGPAGEGYMIYRFKVMPSRESCKQQLQIGIDVEHARCSICLNIWHDIVTVAPCFHNFCNGCFSEWLRRSQEKHSDVLCPQCRAVVRFVGRNHYLRNIEEDILQADSSLRRSDEDIALLDSYSSIRSNLVIRSGKRPRRKRARSPMGVESDGLEVQCIQCGSEFSGFRCNQDTVHLQCQACGGIMPSRTDSSVPQHCVGCDRAFCGAYWHSEGVSGSNTHPLCNRETFMPIAERTISRIPFLAHEKNRHEQDITETCIRQIGKSLQEVISEWIRKLNNREIDRTRMPLNHAELINAGTYVCSNCYDKFVSFLLYWFRITMPKHLLPSDALRREDCWYGHACRTQHHNEEHARKRNHVCRPTRGTDM
ncbi:zf-C3HC4_2 domain-containing protein [Cephalotus follicularis]|uniref:Zf-C3HC4_2 domain-containing protein n=1 Tax=Cephalotus follicularis TaxID=3775 RepID=A0A1Q3C163_CEPFO|nr:zf-C3HC4_2 domain-containing protein [Cephalotus follicularis]